MLKLVNKTHLKCVVVRLVGSSPTRDTNKEISLQPSINRDKYFYKLITKKEIYIEDNNVKATFKFSINKCGEYDAFYSNGTYILLHRLVWMLYNGIIPFNDKCIINHIDGNKRNNIITNLELGTYRDNLKHAMENNLIKLDGSKIPLQLGEINCNAMFLNDDVIKFRLRYVNGDKRWWLFDKTKSNRIMQQMLTGRTYPHLPHKINKLIRKNSI